MSQSERLSAAGFPESIQVSVVEGLLKKCRLDSRPREADIQPAASRSRVAVVPYLHKTAHNLKKVASRVGIKVVFSAPQKLGRISRLTDPHRKPAVGCSKKHRDHFVAQLEQAALVSRDMGDLKAAADLIDKASCYFIDSRSPDTAALVLERGAKIVEAKFPEIAVGFFNRAAEIVSVEDRPRQSAEFCGHAVRLLLKLARWDEAADAVSRQKQLLAEAQDDRAVGRLVVALVLVHLARDDFVAASKAVDYDKGMLGQQVAESAKKTASESKPSAEAVGDAKDVDNGTVDRPEQDHLEVPDSTTAAESDDEFAGGLL
ncbi:hypothetical protein HPB51_029409 [Rhipicephalus microplus]|uniref:Gamma-soluble NSF attachment protein n=1 Tax=Rhipicephalus microplus TaxID=6941 RepID=A0A9J6CUA5_RHIMP|nr:hypothetical protein HPB51_029409 [Rhipicephalus microplus]